MNGHNAFHWPDHAIGKREARRIREEHNRLYNDYAELWEAARKVRLLDTALGINIDPIEAWQALDKAARFTVGDLDPNTRGEA